MTKIPPKNSNCPHFFPPKKYKNPPKKYVLSTMSFFFVFLGLFLFIWGDFFIIWENLILFGGLLNYLRSFLYFWGGFLCFLFFFCIFWGDFYFFGEKKKVGEFLYFLGSFLNVFSGLFFNMILLDIIISFRKMTSFKLKKLTMNALINT
jgi:hypothetical protein